MHCIAYSGRNVSKEMYGKLWYDLDRVPDKKYYVYCSVKNTICIQMYKKCLRQSSKGLPACQASKSVMGANRNLILLAPKSIKFNPKSVKFNLFVCICGEKIQFCDSDSEFSNFGQVSQNSTWPYCIANGHCFLHFTC